LSDQDGWYWKGSAFEVPAAVVSETGMLAGPPGMVGTVTVQIDCVAQLVGAA
jgi:hypothetical protein